MSLLANYFAYVDPSTPVIDKHDFINKYESGNCSLFLLYALLATASLYVPAEAIAACGFVDRSEAQATFAARATLLHDFQFETDLLPALQGSLIMTKVLLEQPTDKDSNYWFYNGLRLATKLEIYSLYVLLCSNTTIILLTMTKQLQQIQQARQQFKHLQKDCLGSLCKLQPTFDSLSRKVLLIMFHKDAPHLSSGLRVPQCSIFEQPSTAGTTRKERLACRADPTRVPGHCSAYAGTTHFSIHRTLRNVCHM